MLSNTSRTNHKYLALIFPLLTLFLLPFAIIPTHPSNPNSASNPNPRPPRLAYLIAGGDKHRLRRLLRAVYHPYNFYLVQLNGDASAEDIADLKVMRKYKNVRIGEKGCHVSEKGPSDVACLLNGMAILMREFEGWSWFVNLDEEDYPLMPQDDILHIFSYLPHDLNFIDHRSNISWKEFEKLRPIVVDPALYISNKTRIFHTKEKRSFPSSFRLFIGSSKMILTKSFVQFCVFSWDNLPRTLLLYYSNFPSSSQSYFQTVLCNSNKFQNTTINHDLRSSAWRVDPLEDESGAPFVSGVGKETAVLDRIDRELLRRGVEYDLFGVIRPSERARKLESFLLGLLKHENFRTRQCK
ncbi:hypothetical protein LUZ60_003832 [Juncus effusus]|nr:hypothetical protein LUZ60_003832 [Juncus effusus]